MPGNLVSECQSLRAPASSPFASCAKELTLALLLLSGVVAFVSNSWKGRLRPSDVEPLGLSHDQQCVLSTLQH